VKNIFGPNSTLVHSYMNDKQLLLVCGQQKEMVLLNLPDFKVICRCNLTSGSFKSGLMVNNLIYGLTD